MGQWIHRIVDGQCVYCEVPAVANKHHGGRLVCPVGRLAQVTKEPVDKVLERYKVRNGTLHVPTRRELLTEKVMSILHNSPTMDIAAKEIVALFTGSE